MSGLTNNFKSSFNNDNVLIKTVRLIVNLLTNILIFITVFICLSYACSGKSISTFHWHIIMCVLGYQLFMCQGILLLSKYNSWSMFLQKNTQTQLHTAFQVIGVILVIVGSSLIIGEKEESFDTTHGILGICALIASTISILNGITAQYAFQISKSYTFLIKYVHYLLGVLTIFLSAGSLSVAFEGIPFKFWAKNEQCIQALIFINWLFTILVALDFWMETAKRISEASRNY